MTIISIIMPTYNAEATIDESLQSIRLQNFPQNDVEILIIDGGSTDNTLEIAKKWNCKIIKNPRRLPEIAKEIGLQAASGKYGIYLDSDEILANKNSLKFRVEIFDTNPNIKNIVSTGMICKQNAKGIVYYANAMADPFSNYVYQFNGFDRSEDLCRDYAYSEFNNYYVFDFEKATKLPLFDAAGNMFDMKFARELYNLEEDKSNFAANIFEKMVIVTKCAAMIKEDFVYHNPSLSCKIYMRKLKWRVKNNVFPKKNEGVGFTSRETTSPELISRKYLFVFYCISIILPLIDSVKLAHKYKNNYFYTHWFYTEYTFLQIVFFMLMKFFHITPKEETSYGR